MMAVTSSLKCMQNKWILALVMVCALSYFYLGQTSEKETSAHLDSVSTKDKTMTAPATPFLRIPEAAVSDPDESSQAKDVTDSSTDSSTEDDAQPDSAAVEPVVTTSDAIDEPTPPEDTSNNENTNNKKSVESPGDSSASGSTSTLSTTTSTVKALQHSFDSAYDAVIQRLQEDYGHDNFEEMFLFDGGVNRGRFAFRSSNTTAPTMTEEDDGISRKRLVDRVVQKLLRNLVVASDTNNNQEKKPETFVWATGGHSSAAGHGNFFDESYTAVLSRVATPVFAAAGIQFTGRNYAMGAAESAPELAWCIEEVFGTDDLDIVSWDFGMTDGDDPNRMRLYCYRIGLNVNSPACVTVHVGRRGIQDLLLDLENRGMMAFYPDEDIFNSAREGVPDSLGKSTEEIMAMPPFVRNYRCGKEYEAGEPYCAAQKFNMTMCTERKFRVNWHQGWKFHALHGNLMGLFLVELLKDAIAEIGKIAPADYEQALQKLEEARSNNYKLLLESELPAGASDIWKEYFDIRLEDIYRTPTYCHNARVPAEIRHKGILLEGEPGDMFHYQEGVSEEEADANPHSSEFMQLVRDMTDRQKCEVPLNIDYKDFFYLEHEGGWKKLILPNDAELKEYGKGRQPLKGLISVCFSVCLWGECPQGNLLPEQINSTTAEIEVNGKRVTGFTQLARCHFLRGEQGHYWTPNADGRLEIRARTLQEKTYLRIGAFIVW